jgi:hypothetical protein
MIEVTGALDENGAIRITLRETIAAAVLGPALSGA